nr:ead/Ea22-like family protein [Klebsiella michiganensis]
MKRRATSANEFGESLYVKGDDVLALVEALEYYKSREERVTSLVRNNSKSWDELYRQVEAKGKRNVELVEALEKAQQRIDSQREYYDGVIADGGKRIAELESKLANPVQLPKTNGYWTETEKAYEEAITLAKRQIRLAGFRCEGGE